jgi:amino acid adenylation domain-containing protein
VTADLLHFRLAGTVQRFPERLAVDDGESRLTYAELDARSSQFAHVLGDVGVGPGKRVAIYLDKSCEAVAAIYGILKTGAAYVPLDPQSPAPRLARILADCEVSCLVTESAKAAALADLFSPEARPGAVLVVDGTHEIPDGPHLPPVVMGDALDGAPTTVPSGAVDADADDLAYILYTSGSTGNPKGVMLSHANALAFVDWGIRTFDIGPEDRLSSHAPFHFDLSVFDLFAASGAGAAVVLVPAGMSVLPPSVRRFISDSEITVWYSVPSVLSMLATRGGLAPGDLGSLRLVLFAGEVFPTKFLVQLMHLLPGARFANLYGPTETNVCTWYDVPDLGNQEETIPIGLAIDGVDVFTVDPDTGAAVIGPGELYVEGPTVAHGYWNDPERTARSFVADPRPDQHGRCYRTGDLVEHLPDGNIRFLGRIDSQVKSRGYRIELGEIESVLVCHDDVVECAVVAVPDDLLTSRLRAFVVTGGQSSSQELIRFCGERLPRYMVPESVEMITALPRTSTGKIDRQILAATGVHGYTP